MSNKLLSQGGDITITPSLQDRILCWDISHWKSYKDYQHLKARFSNPYLNEIVFKTK